MDLEFLSAHVVSEPASGNLGLPTVTVLIVRLRLPCRGCGSPGPLGLSCLLGGRCAASKTRSQPWPVGLPDRQRPAVRSTASTSSFASGSLFRANTELEKIKSRENKAQRSICVPKDELGEAGHSFHFTSPGAP